MRAPTLTFAVTSIAAGVAALLITAAAARAAVDPLEPFTYQALPIPALAAFQLLGSVAAPAPVATPRRDPALASACVRDAAPRRACPAAAVLRPCPVRNVE